MGIETVVRPAVDADPDLDGVTVAFHLRFPGQYFDGETGFHYNYFRTYDPLTGRYLTSDPIGLAGGLNPFAYALNNPVTGIDPYGLRQAATSPSDIRNYSKASKYVRALIRAVPIASTAAVADGPLPVGDIIGGLIIVGFLIDAALEDDDGGIDDGDGSDCGDGDNCELWYGDLQIQKIRILQESTSAPAPGVHPFTHRLKVKRMIEAFKKLAKEYNAKCVPKGFPYVNPDWTK